MAEVLILNRTDLPANVLAYRRGDPVLVFPDGQPWGVEERNFGKFVIIQLPGVPVEDVRPYVVGAFAGVDAKGDPIRIHRRRYMVDLDALPANLRNRQTITRTRAQFLNLVVDKQAP